MGADEVFSNVVLVEQSYLAERELYSFIAAVIELYGPEQARLSEEDWFLESEMMDAPRSPANLQWRDVTIAASVRLAGRLSTNLDHAAAHRNRVNELSNPGDSNDIRD